MAADAYIEMAKSAAVAGDSQSTEFDVAQAPITIPTMVSVAVTLIPVDPR